MSKKCITKKPIERKKRSGAYSRRKGHSFEREIAIDLRPHLIGSGAGFPEARRQLEYHADDAKGVDIQGCDPYKIQCKNTAKYVPLNTIKEIQCDREFGDIPILVAKAANEPTLATLYWEDLLRMMKRLKEYESEQ